MSSRLNLPAVRNTFNYGVEALRNYMLTLPVLTLGIAVICASCYSIHAFTWGKLNLATELGLWAEGVKSGQVYRLITYPFPHVGFLHIFFNMIAFIPLSAHFELSMGTFRYLYIFFVVFTFLPASIYILSSLLPFIEAGLLAGTSTLIFILVVWECRVPRPLSFCGLFNIPSTVYPLFLLLITSILFSGVAFWGHFIAMAVGYAYIFNYFKIIIPATGYFQRLEERTFLTKVVNHPRFVRSVEQYGLLPTFQTEIDPSDGSISTNSDSRRGIRTASPIQSNNPSSNASPNPFPGPGRSLDS
ncbi:Rhomboid domain-containing protein 2 [Basidiobolus ranarum]|uniref:rhomboid protease n=1 Tax=Basidiobolus ranarum TaxID=34480 RepID=A0ABR2W216_9FUNG